jgi:hypothetical protein
MIMMSLLSSSAFADEALRARGEVNWRYGDDRSILMNELWIPISQDETSVLYGDLRLMGDDADNREGNLGIGYRQITSLPSLGEGVVGVHGWIDRRITKRGSKFHQVTTGVEWLGESVDLRLNGYIPLSDAKEYSISNANPQGPALIGTGIVVDTNGTILEESQSGFDLELGYELGQSFDYIKKNTDSFRIYGGGYYFEGKNTENIAGLRGRFTADISQNIQIGARFQRDDERGSQGFLEATFRFPFGHKKSYRKEGLHARLGDSPERDIDIVTGDAITDTGDRVAVINKQTGQAQEVLHVDNTAAGGGNGSSETPYNALADAQSAASAGTIIYVHAGDGAATNQDQGIILDKTDQQLIGSGANFFYDSGKFETANGVSPTSILIAPATSAPVITNVSGDGITVSADNTTVTGVTVDGADRDGIVVNANNASIKYITSQNNSRHGVYALNVDNTALSFLSTTGNAEDGIRLEADGAASALTNALLNNITATGNKNGVRFYAKNDAGLTGSMALSTLSGNTQHGVIVYDDSTAGSVTADLGGGSMDSVGLNILAGNTLEDLTVDLDGGMLMARNNWWGQATGADQDNPSVGIAPQIYYGAPIDDGLVGHWTFDTEWTSDTIAYDRSGQGNNGTLQGGLSLTNQVPGQRREALDFNGTTHEVIIGNIAGLTFANSDSFTFYSFADPADTNTTGYSFSKVSTTEGVGAYYKMNADTISLPKHSGTAPWDGDPIFAGDGWLNGTSVFVNQNVTHYIDGVDAGTRGGNNFTTPTTSNAKIGNREGGTSNLHYFQGVLDDIRVYDRALNQSEIQELYRSDTVSTVNVSGPLSTAP